MEKIRESPECQEAQEKKKEAEEGNWKVGPSGSLYVGKREGGKMIILSYAGDGGDKLRKRRRVG